MLGNLIMTVISHQNSTVLLEFSLALYQSNLYQYLSVGLAVLKEMRNRTKKMMLKRQKTKTKKKKKRKMNWSRVHQINLKLLSQVIWLLFFYRGKDTVNCNWSQSPHLNHQSRCSDIVELKLRYSLAMIQPLGPHLLYQFHGKCNSSISAGKKSKMHWLSAVLDSHW